jgi:hypothetical protein
VILFVVILMQRCDGNNGGARCDSPNAYDELATILKFLVNAGLEPNELYSLSQIAEKFLHVKLDIDNIYELANISFDDFLMANQSLFYDEETGAFIGFDKIAAEDGFFLFKAMGFPNIILF